MISSSARNMCSWTGTHFCLAFQPELGMTNEVLIRFGNANFKDEFRFELSCGVLELDSEVGCFHRCLYPPCRPHFLRRIRFALSTLTGQLETPPIPIGWFRGFQQISTLRSTYKISILYSPRKNVFARAKPRNLSPHPV